MSSITWFHDLAVIGEMPVQQAVAKLQELGEVEEAAALSSVHQGRSPKFGASGLFEPKPWQHTAHAFGYVAPGPPGSQAATIQHAGNMAADISLKNNRIKITLDRLRVAAYPGKGPHRVLFDFYAQNQVPGTIEHLHFNSCYRVLEGQEAGITGYPIFIGLNVGSDGVAFRCFTVNVQNDNDEALLASMESDVFKSGLRLCATLQPAIAPLSAMAVALTRNIAVRHRNVPVQDFYMGLDFTDVRFRARLAVGSYVAVQIPDSLVRVWDWRDWVYDPVNGQIVDKDDAMRLIPFNYVVFSVSAYEE